MPAAVEIRRAEPHDAPRLVALYMEIAPEAVAREPRLRRVPSREALEGVYVRRVEDSERGVFLAWTGDQAVGFVDVRLGRTAEDASLSHPMLWGYVEDIVVSGRYRRQGIARQLMDAAHTGSGIVAARRSFSTRT